MCWSREEESTWWKARATVATLQGERRGVNAARHETVDLTPREDWRIPLSREERMNERIEASKWCVLERDLRPHLVRYEALRREYHGATTTMESERLKKDVLWAAMGIANYISLALGVSVPGGSVKTAAEESGGTRVMEERHAAGCSFAYGGECTRSCRARGVEDIP